MRKKKNTRQTGANTTPLSGHTRRGKSLVPPMMTLPGGFAFSSWTNDRLPEMLWAALVITALRREEALAVFREVASIGVKYESMGEAFKEFNLNISGLAKQPPEMIATIVGSVKKHRLGKIVLRPLLLFDSLPAGDIWKTEIDAEPTDEDWPILAKAILTTFDHQSQESTDIRWLRLMFKACLGTLIFHQTLADRAEELRLYPNKGDMTSVRPFIRATEMSLDIEISSENSIDGWAVDFWNECMNRTSCTPIHRPKDTRTLLDVKAFVQSVANVRMSVVEHWEKTLSTTAVDPRHDAVFGFALYVLSCALEMSSASNRYAISGRLFLRCLTECRITLAYLVCANDPNLWSRFRSYGAGQAKLALLKTEAISGTAPNFVEKATLEALANEDFFQEFVEIDLGHWCGKDLRKMAEDSGTKDDYDKFYGWASGFVHGQWGAIRDSNLTHCMNPLHRFHRIPLWSHRPMGDALSDAVGLVNSILETVEKAYPGELARLSIPQPTNEAQQKESA